MGWFEWFSESVPNCQESSIAIVQNNFLQNPCGKFTELGIQSTAQKEMTNSRPGDWYVFYQDLEMKVRHCDYHLSPMLAYFCDKIPWQKELEGEVYLNLYLKGTGHQGGKILVTRAWGSCHIGSTVKKQREWWIPVLGSLYPCSIVQDLSLENGAAHSEGIFPPQLTQSK